MERSQDGPYLGAVLGLAPPHMALQVTLKEKLGVTFEVLP
jgi:hypothetical protein